MYNILSEQVDFSNPMHKIPTFLSLNLEDQKYLPKIIKTQIFLLKFTKKSLLFG